MICDYIGKYRLIALARALSCAAVCCNSAIANEQLMEKSGCIACHRVDEKLIGPAFKAVAEKYKPGPKQETLNYLINQVREGSEDVWGDIPMAPNPPNKISDEDLKTLLEWVLSL